MLLSGLGCAPGVQKQRFIGLPWDVDSSDKGLILKKNGSDMGLFFAFFKGIPDLETLPQGLPVEKRGEQSLC